MRSEHPATPRPIGQRPRVGRASPLLALVLLGATVLAGCLPRPSVLARPTLAMVPHTSAMAPRPTLDRLPLTIVENQGQLEPAIGYYVPGATTSIAFTPAGLRLALTRPSERAAEVADVDQDGRRPGPAGLEPPRRWTVALDFLGADPDARPVGIAPSAAVVSYFVGPAEAWRTGLPTYGGVAYPGLWPGIDLVYQGAGGQLKYEYRLQPGADPAQIQLAYRGATDVALADDGALVVTTPLGGLRDAAPYAYQEIDGQRVAVSAAYALAAPADGADGQRYGFALGAYDPTRPLVLDPAIVVYGGYIGGPQGEDGYGIAVDQNGNVYVVGQTFTPQGGFPVLGGPDLSPNGSYDAFVAKVRPDGTGLVYAGYIGGAGGDNGLGVAVDAAGSAYVVGTTSSSAASFPAAVGPDLSYNGISDAFVVKIAEPTAGADLSVGLLDEPEPVPIGQPMRYTLRVDNAGPEAATGVTLSDPLPIGASLARVEPSQGTCQAEDGVLTCALGRLAVGARATVRLIVTPTVVGALALTVTVSSDVADPNRANNRATARTAVLATVPDVAALPDPKTDRDKARRLTEEQRQQRRRTDTSSLDDTRTEGNVVGTRCHLSAPLPTLSQGFVAQPDSVPYLLIGMRDGVQQVLLLYDTASQCATIQSGDYLQADGEKVHEQLFEAHHATVTRGGRRVR